MTYRLGSLFSGYGGLDLAVSDVLGTQLAWVADDAKTPAAILAHRFPDVPNLGDVRAIDWEALPVVDVLTGGFPCQDVSHAGKQLGLHPDSRSGLWSHMAYAIDVLRPALVVIENVRGILSAPSSGDVEPCAGCVGDPPARTAVRALGAVLADLARLRYDAQWACVSAAAVGAPHLRRRIFIAAWPASHTRRRRIWEQNAHEWATKRAGNSRAAGRPLPTPAARDVKGRYPRGQHEDLNALLLPTPSAFHMKSDETPEQWLTRRADVEARTGTKHGPALSVVAQTLLTEGVLVQDGTGPHLEPTGDGWGPYGAHLRRWAAITGRDIPEPTITLDGTQRLSPVFVEWLMGLPEGWVTDVPYLSWRQQLLCLGNGVVPAQAADALSRLLISVQAADALGIVA